MTRERKFHSGPPAAGDTASPRDGIKVSVGFARLSRSPTRRLEAGTEQPDLAGMWPADADDATQHVSTARSYVLYGAVVIIFID